MKMYETLMEAVEICKNTYRGRTYTVQEETTGEILTGSAADIAGEFILRKLMNQPNTFWPIDESSIEECALMETLFLVGLTPPIKYPWEFAAGDLYNQIIEEAEAEGE